MMIVTPRFTEALTYAAALHAEQRRKVSGEPYLAHLLAVAAIVMEHGGDEDEAIAALLHDAVEDQGGEATLEEIRRRFGPTVAEIVAGCSDTMVSPKPPWRQRKEAHIAHLRRRFAFGAVGRGRRQTAQHRFAGAGVSPPRRSLWAVFHGGRDGTLWYYRAVADASAKPPPRRSSKSSISRWQNSNSLATDH